MARHVVTIGSRTGRRATSERPRRHQLRQRDSKRTDGNAHPRVCDLGILRQLYKRPDGSVGYRCRAEPVVAPALGTSGDEVADIVRFMPEDSDAHTAAEVIRRLRAGRLVQ